MKKLLYILLFIPLFALSQTIDDFSYPMPVTDNNMTVVFPSGTLYDFAGGELQAYAWGIPLSNSSTIEANGAGGVAVIGADSFCGCSLANPLIQIEFAILVNGETIVIVDVNPPIIYVANTFEMLDGNTLTFTINGATVIHGCVDNNYLEFDASANLDDGSCEVLRIDGCTDSEACNYISEANFDDGSCLYLDYEQSLFNACCLGNSITTICLLDEDICSGEDVDCITYGCTEQWADNYDPFITQDDGSCFKEGCISDWADNYDAIATTDDGSCDRLGCTSDWADNYDAIATTNDGSCYKYGCISEWADNYDAIATTDDGSCFRYGCILDWADNYDYLATIDDSSCYRYGCISDWADNYDILATLDDLSCYKIGCTNVLALNYDELVTDDDGTCEYEIITQLTLSNDAWNISINLDEGWNMFGYGCPNPIDVIVGLSNHTESILITKDNNGAVYLPEWDFNGIGDLTPGFGYQIKVSEYIEHFSLCENYINDVSANDLESILEELSSNSDSLLQMNNTIVSLQEENASLQAELDSIYGCIDETACNYDETASLDDGSCYNNDLGCGCDTPGPIDGFDCDGNITEYVVGMEAEGGIVFYVDETGESGLVAAMEDLTEGATDPYGFGYNGYEWGCYGESVDDADSLLIGTGYWNTINIVSQGCETENGGITAAQAALDAEINGYSDWYLPSRDDLVQMYISIGNNGSQGNIGNFNSGWYWSSSEGNSIEAFGVGFSNGNSFFEPKSSPNGRVRVIRAF